MQKVLLVTGLVLVYAVNLVVEAERDRIIIGILAQESNPKEQIPNRQVIVASYVKFVESAGARVVPIFIRQDRSYYERMIKRINGVLMPGGDLDIMHTKYAEAASLLIKLTTELNQNGTYFPLWGTCMSFEKIITDYVSNMSWVTPCEVEDMSLNLELDANINSTRMFQNKIIPNILEIVQNRKVAAHYHNLCLSVSDFYKLGLNKDYTLVSRNTLGNLTFVSTIEHRRYPIYGTAWHPEKNQFEYVLNTHLGHVNHDQYAVVFGQYLANFFVNEARKNNHHFASMKEELNALIFNYNQYRMYTSKDGYAYDEIFEFPYTVKINI